MQLARVTEVRRPAYHYSRDAVLTNPATAVSTHFSKTFSPERILRWQLFSPTSLKESAFNGARLTAINEITGSLRKVNTLSALFEKIADGFNDIFPYANLDIEFRADILSKDYPEPNPQDFPYMFDNGRSELMGNITREATSVEDVNQRMMGLPLLDSSDNLLGMIVLSLADGLSRFPESVKPFAEQMRLVASMRIESLKESIIDPLTDLGNRGYFDERINQEFERSHRYKKPLSLLLLDIDHFKECNDNHGHPFGDKVLKEFAEILREETRKEVDLPMRYGGEEFAIILPETSGEGAYRLAERIRKRVQEHDFKTDDGTTVPITVSIGVSTLGYDTNKDNLIGNADKNLYTAKKTGRNKVVAGSD